MFATSDRRAIAYGGGLRVAGLALALTLALAGCAGSSKKPQPKELAPVTALLGTQLAWTAQLGPSDTSLTPIAVAGRVFAASSAGTVVALDAASGRDVWRLNLGDRIATGVGSDGELAAVVTLDNQLVAIANGAERWRVRLPAGSYTPPLVAGKRVFLMTADRAVSAFDGQTGARLWNQTRTGDPLVLRQNGVLTAVGDTLVAGISGRLTGLNPLSGSVQWEAPIATARGTNEIERLVDLVGPVSREGNSVCARAYTAAVGCVDASRGLVLWTRAAQGLTGVHGDDKLVFGAESDGTVKAWQRDSGEQAWTVDRLQYRELTGPLAVGRVVVIGDGAGLVHLLSREDGSEMTRLSTDGSPVISAPILAGNAVLVQTQKGGLFAWRPQ
ncbi:outer membrane protein assembly factor BamB [Hydrogenophaga sp.]|uniref:outer membrane protein assembly factor BamB n=1 Tax=Hydrogenophaga sp. TaxID=1904254 RepID=UPI003569D3A8